MTERSAVIRIAVLPEAGQDDRADARSRGGDHNVVHGEGLREYMSVKTRVVFRAHKDLGGNGLDEK